MLFGFESDDTGQLRDETARQSRWVLGIGLTISLLKFRHSRSPAKDRGPSAFWPVAMLERHVTEGPAQPRISGKVHLGPTPLFAELANPHSESQADILARSVPFELHHLPRATSSSRAIFIVNTHFRTAGITALPLASCQRIAFNACASAASGREKSIRADCFAPGAFFSFLW